MKHIDRTLGVFALIMMGSMAGLSCSGPGPGPGGPGGGGPSGTGTSSTGPGGSGPGGSGPGGSALGECDGGTAPCALWSKNLGDHSDQSPYGIATDNAGNVYVTGAYGAVDGPSTGGVNYDVFIAKLDPAGNLLWIKTFGDADDQQANSIAVDGSGEIVITGTFAGTVSFGSNTLSSSDCVDIFIAKFDTDGNEKWSHSFGDVGCQFGEGIAMDASGNVLFVGSARGNIDFGGGTLADTSMTADVVMAKLGPDGNHVWSKRFAQEQDQRGQSIAVDASGNVLISGSMQGSADFGGGPLLSTPYGNIFIAKYNPQGTHLWSRGFGKSSHCDLAVDSADNVLLTGTGGDGISFGFASIAGGIFIAKLDAGGNHLWSRGFGGIIGFVPFPRITHDSSDNVLVTGAFTQPVNFGGGPLAHIGTDVFIAKLTSAGYHVWSGRFGNGTVQAGRAIATDSMDNVLVTGDYGYAIDFGVGEHISFGQHDVFVAKLHL